MWLLNEFLERHLAVHFKYQLQSKAETCDRIVVYSDFNHKVEVEQALANVYQKYPQLFEGSERSLSWIHQSKIPKVYIAPEKSGTSYGEQFAEVLMRAKNIVNYLYNNVEESRKIKFANKQIEKYVREEIKAIVVALMLKEGMILKKDDSFIQIIDRDSPDYNLNMNYTSNGELYQTFHDGKYWYEIKYENSIAARDYLRKMLYGIGHPDINKSIPGVKMRRLTIQERREELNRQLYPHLYQNNQNSSNPKVYCKKSTKKGTKPNQ